MAQASPGGETQVDRSLAACRPLAGRLYVFGAHSLLITSDEARIEGADTGFFHHRTRFLSELDFKICGERPRLASASLLETDRLLAYHLAPVPAHDGGGQGEMRERGLEVQVEAQVGERLRLQYAVTNRNPAPQAIRLEWRARSDFVDQEQAGSGGSRQQAGARWDGRSLRLESPHPKLRHATRLAFSGPATFDGDEDRVSCDLALAPQQTVTLEVTVSPLFDPAFSHELPHRSGRDRRRWLDACARLETDDELLGLAWRRAVADIAGLQLGDGEGDEIFVPAAGAPHYIALFGRDTLMAGWQTQLLNPATLRGVLGLVGRWTATDYEPERDAQPGRVLHQRQLGPAALLGESPYLRYYGDHSASGLFLLSLASLFAQTGDVETFRASRDVALRVLEWMDRDGDLDGDGIYEYRTLAGPKGLKNQGWKDSRDAILYPDARLPEDPLAVCEIQALFFAAKRAMGLAFQAAGEAALGARLLDDAEALKARFDARFWMEDEGFYALALDAQKQPVRTIASNPGACLGYGVVPEAKAARVAERLMREDMYSGWGVRTLSAAHPAYNPLAYHLGSVWPSSNALMARGFARYGLDGHLSRLTHGLMEASRLFEFRRLPELFGGHDRAASAHPGLYPEACSPQVWSAGAIVSMIFSLAGVRPAAPLGVVALDPRLPEWAPRMTLRGLPIGKGWLSLELRRREDGASEAKVLENSTGLRVIEASAADSGDAEAIGFASAFA